MKYIKTIKSISMYFGASLIPMLLNLAINPLIAMNMQPKDYAIIGFYTSFNTLISPLIAFYMFHYYTKKFFEVDENERERLKSTLIKMLIYFSGALSVICFLSIGAYYYYANIKESFPFFPYALLTVFALPLTGIYTLTTVDYRMQRKSLAFFKISLINGLTLVITNILFVVAFKWGATGKLLAPFITNFIFFTYCLYKYRNTLKYKFEWDRSKKIIFFCLPLTLAGMLTFFTGGYDRVLLEKIGDVNELGYYTVGIQIASYISVFQASISSTFQPDVFQAIVQKDNKRLFKVITLLIGSTAFIVLSFIVCAPIIIDILTAGRYNDSVKYSQIAALAPFTSALFYNVEQITIARGKTSIPLINRIISSILCILMFNYLITEYKYIGAAWGLVLSFSITLIINIFLLKIYSLRNKTN